MWRRNELIIRKNTTNKGLFRKRQHGFRRESRKEACEVKHATLLENKGKSKHIGFIFSLIIMSMRGFDYKIMYL